MTKHQLHESQKSGPPEANVGARLPPWFLRDCVKTSDDLKDAPTTLVIEDAEPEGKQTPTAGSSTGIYRMDAAFFDSMCSIVQPTTRRPSKPGEPTPGQPDSICFTKNGMLLQYLNRSSWDNYGWRFLESVVEYFARTIGADMITLTLDNVKALALHFAGTAEADSPINIDDLMKLTFHNSESQTAGETHPQPAQEKRFPFREVLSAPLVKARADLSGAHPKLSKPLVIHLPKISTLHSAFGGAILRSLRSAVYQPSPQNYADNVIFIATDIENPLTSIDPSIIKLLGSKPAPKALRLVPVNSKEQKALLVQDGEYKDPGSARMHRLANIRALKYAARVQYPDSPSDSLVHSESDWTFLDGTRAGKIFDSGILSTVDIDDMVFETGGQLDNANIEKSILRMGQREEILDAWKATPNKESEEKQDPAPTNKWSSFPENIRKAIDEIVSDKEKYKRESEFLDLIVNPNEVDDGWDDIALDPDTKEAIQQILPGMKPDSGTKKDYGVLKRGRIGGALLYGPPGTGKTHLARVIARECKAVTICASGADIEDMYVGETEKIIKGLFNLGKMLVPSIIFIDEADALFRARQPGERSWKRSQTNQLLSEMDGLSRSKSSPFVLLATNFPNDLDHALLRRVPSRIYIGLPSAQLRERILGIMLKDETLGPDLDLARLADRTRRFSGSDIQSLSVQAALICDAFVEDGKDKGKRVLGQLHFAKALQRVSPTTSQKALALIKHFANEFDPPGFERILSMEAKEGAIQMGAGASLGHMTPGQLAI